MTKKVCINLWEMTSLNSHFCDDFLPSHGNLSVLSDADLFLHPEFTLKVMGADRIPSRAYG
jgi:hypothetical protein